MKSKPCSQSFPPSQSFISDFGPVCLLTERKCKVGCFKLWETPREVSGGEIKYGLLDPHSKVAIKYSLTLKQRAKQELISQNFACTVWLRPHHTGQFTKQQERLRAYTSRGKQIRAASGDYHKVLQTFHLQSEALSLFVLQALSAPLEFISPLIRGPHFSPPLSTAELLGCSDV